MWDASLEADLKDGTDQIIIVLEYTNLLHSEIKVDCITVSTTSVKGTIDDHIQRLMDALLITLRFEL